MKNPIALETKKFTPIRIILEHDTFVVADGTTGDGENNLAMRWMGETDESKGFPTSHSHPVWFIVHKDLRNILISGLINSPLQGVDKGAIIDSLKEIYSTDTAL